MQTKKILIKLGAMIIEYISQIPFCSLEPPVNSFPRRLRSPDYKHLASATTRNAAFSTPLLTPPPNPLEFDESF